MEHTTKNMEQDIIRFYQDAVDISKKYAGNVDEELSEVLIQSIRLICWSINRSDLDKTLSLFTNLSLPNE